MNLMFYLNVMEKITAENKEMFLLGDFNIDLLKIDDENKIDEFYNIMYKSPSTTYHFLQE